MTDTSGYNEKELLQLVVEGDEKAFRSLFDHYRNKIFSIAYRMVKTTAEAEDVVSEVFIKLWVNRRKLAGLVNFNAYINTITRNHIFNHLRRLATEEAFIKELLAGDTQDNDTTQRIAYNELKRILDETVNRLPPRQKEVYRLGKLEGMPYGEIASELHISRETVKFHMGEALRTIKASLSRI
jgi:RNA polymerase sigma-70 factor (ECF subfamily)